MFAVRFAVSSVLAILVLVSPLSAAELVTRESAHSVDVTIDRLETLLAERGIGVMARIDHSANAEKVGLELAPSLLLLFGDPAKGTVLMQEKAEIGIDLPMKAMAWEDADGRVWLAHVLPSSIADERGLSDATDTVVALDRGLDGLTAAAAAP